MIKYIVNTFSDVHLRKRISYLYGLLISFNVLVWIWALWIFHNNPVLLGSAVLAYSFGLRHAVDADHIAAIDNVSRKLIQQGKRSVSVGLFFSLGHSSIVIISTISIVIVAGLAQDHFLRFREISSVIGISFSIFFLLVIALINLLTFFATYKVFKKVSQGKPVTQDLTLLFSNSPLAKHFSRLFNMITRSWHMYFVGAIFGLGFDTATEIGLLSIAAVQAASGLSIWAIMIFPALFTAAMTLIDTTDNILMIGVYGWAHIKPIRKLFYNLTITFISVIVAVLISSLEVLNLLANKLKLSGTIWSVIKSINDNFTNVGYFIIGIFVISWLVSIMIYHVMNLDSLELEQSAQDKDAKF